MTSKISKLGGGDRFQPADFTIQRFVAKIPTDTTLEDILQPEYFANHLDRMKPGMEITALSDDFALDATLRVLTITKTTANVRVLNVYAEPKAADEAPEAGDGDKAVTASWGGPSQKWRVVHGETIIQQGLATKEEAQAAAKTYSDLISAEAE